MNLASLLEWASGLGERAKQNEPLAPYTSMRVGGPADLLLLCQTTEEIVEAVKQARAAGVPWLVLGGGCNVLVSDAGVRGLVLVHRAARSRIGANGAVWAEAGAPIASLARETATRGLAGLEWAAGLPGTVGGAIVGNAGAFGGAVASVLQSVTLLEPAGEVTERPAEWMEFAYRESRLKRLPRWERPVVLAATFSLSPGDPTALRAQTEEVLAWRRTRHPSGATMGSTFKNPPGGYAGRLIEQAGLKGYRIGGAMVSEGHANFLLNTGSATAADVMALIRHVQAEVERLYGVRLEPEVEFIGWDE